MRPGNAAARGKLARLVVASIIAGVLGSVPVAIIRYAIDGTLTTPELASSCGALTVLNLGGGVLVATAVWFLAERSRSRRRQVLVVVGCNVTLALLLVGVLVVYFGPWLLLGSNVAYVSWPAIMAGLGVVPRYVVIRR